MNLPTDNIGSKEGADISLYRGYKEVKVKVIGQ